MKKLILVPALLLAVSACATAPKDITPTYVSTLQYQNLTCAQLQTEAQNVSNAAMAASGAQQKKADGDNVAMGVGLIVFWPALFFMKGNGTDANAVAQLKGQMQAIQSVSDAKKCGITFQSQ
jgi:hypothetical protein